MAMFQFVKMAAVAILDFRNFKILTEVLWGSDCAKLPNFVEIGQQVKPLLRYRDFSIFFKMAAAAI